MDKLTKLGTIVYAIPFFVFGVSHFIRAGALANYIPSYFPVPLFWVYLVGIALLAASISIIIKKYTRLACLLLALMLLIFVFLIHIPMLFNEQMMSAALTNLLKDVALAGGAMVVGGVSSRPEAL